MEGLIFRNFTVFKVSLRTGTVPDDWKLANVTPIHKKGSRQLAENYCFPYLYMLQINGTHSGLTYFKAFGWLRYFK